MPNTKEIKKRINSVKSTQKITSAMYMISSTKLRKAKAELDRTRPYFHLQEQEIKRIFASNEEAGNTIYFYPETGRRPAETYAYLVITADKGLAGAYNHNVLKAAEAEMKMHKNVKLYVVGEYGRHYFQKHHVPIEKSFLYTAQNPTFRRAREISSILLTEYEEGHVDEIRVIYSDMENDITSTVKRMQLLPLPRLQFVKKHMEMKAENAEWAEERAHHEAEIGRVEKAGRLDVEKMLEDNVQYDFHPSVTGALKQIMPGYVAGFIYGALVDSFSAEQNARMNAMSSANDNAEQLLGNLSVEYNRVRQAAITQEITEVAAGAKAQKRKRMKKEAGQH